MSHLSGAKRGRAKVMSEKTYGERDMMKMSKSRCCTAKELPCHAADVALREKNRVMQQEMHCDGDVREHDI